MVPRLAGGVPPAGSDGGRSRRAYWGGWAPLVQVRGGGRALPENSGSDGGGRLPDIRPEVVGRVTVVTSHTEHNI